MVNLLLLSLTAAVLIYWWHSGSFKGRARFLATAHCEQLELQLLDQSVVICGLWPQLTPQKRWALRRRYQFEFTSTGRHRYQGRLELQGMKLKSIELETYAID